MGYTHPLKDFQFCPICGEKTFLIYNEKAKKCSHCHFEYYYNTASSVAAFIINPKGELLLCRRAKAPYKGTLDLPGGFVDLHETAEEAVMREIKEELNLRVNELSYCFSLPNTYPYSGFTIHTLDLFFECHVNSFDNMQPADDVSEAFFANTNAINLDDFGLISIRKGLELFLK